MSVEAGLLLGSLVLLVGLLAVRLSYRIGLPGLLLYLGLGLVLGLGVTVTYSSADTVRSLGWIALVVILAEGGLTSRWENLRSVIYPSGVLATVGVIISVAVVALVARPIFGDWRTAVLMAAIVASTDAAAVFSVLRRIKLQPRVAGMLEAESGINDAPAVILVTLAASDEWGQHAWYVLAVLLVVELAGGAFLGYLIGRAGALLLPRIALPAVGLYPLAVLAMIMAAYASATLVHLSGLLAVYVSALLLGNSRMPHRRAVLGFVEGLAWLAQIGLFVLLGLLAFPHRLPGDLLPALAIGLVLMLVARPLATAICLTPFKVPWRVQAFVSWAGLRGAVPIVFATVPLSEGTPQAARVFDVTFVLVLVFTLLQAPTLPWAARVLGVSAPEEPGETGIETAPLDEMNAELLQVDVMPGSGLVGCYLQELGLPRGADVALVVREGRSWAPRAETRFRAGDRLLVVATVESRRLAERRLRAVARRGPLAEWFGETGAPG